MFYLNLIVAIIIYVQRMNQIILREEFFMNAILIIEDDKMLNDGIALTLNNYNMKILQAYTIKEAEKIIEDNSIELIILDVNLPDGNGFEFCANIRLTYKTPIIFLTACDMEIDQVRGLELGADDYITKPFSLMVLRARVMALLRRNTYNMDNTIKIDDMSFDFERMIFKKGGEQFTLSITEQKLLKILCTNAGNILTREQLIDKIWCDNGEYISENALNVTVKRLREKIEGNPSKPEYIKNVYGLGYMWSKDKKNE